jgi:hypothetical protein
MQIRRRSHPRRILMSQGRGRMWRVRGMCMRLLILILRC